MKHDVLLYLGGVLIGIMIGGLVNLSICDSYMKSEAIKHGAAQYKIVDENSGRVEFVWKDIK